MERNNLNKVVKEYNAIPKDIISNPRPIEEQISDKATIGGIPSNLHSMTM